MKKVLHIISSPRKEFSYSTRLGTAVVDKIREAYPDADVRTFDLTDPPIPMISGGTLLRNPGLPEDSEAVARSEQYIKDLQETDILVISSPTYNFGISTWLKAWVDHICRAGKTFRFTEAGFEGLLKGKKVYLAIASGGVYSQGPMVSFEFVQSYLTKTLGFIGMTDLTAFRAEGVDLPGGQENALQRGIDSIVL